MFNQLKQKLGIIENDQLPDLEQDQELNTMDTLDMDDQDIDPEEILDDPNSSFEIKKQAMQMIRDRYLKPQDEQ